MIEARHLSKLYSRGLYALQDLSLTVDKGEFVFLTGPSGAGKSTFLRLLLIQDRPSDGELLVNGYNLGKLSRRSGRDGSPFSMRWILCHMIEEYARHNGHADLIRECIDGATGD